MLDALRNISNKEKKMLASTACSLSRPAAGPVCSGRHPTLAVEGDEGIVLNPRSQPMAIVSSKQKGLQDVAPKLTPPHARPTHC